MSNLFLSVTLILLPSNITHHRLWGWGHSIRKPSHQSTHHTTPVQLTPYIPPESQLLGNTHTHVPPLPYQHSVFQLHWPSHLFLIHLCQTYNSSVRLLPPWCFLMLPDYYPTAHSAGYASQPHHSVGTCSHLFTCSSSGQMVNTSRTRTLFPSPKGLPHHSTGFSKKWVLVLSISQYSWNLDEKGGGIPEVSTTKEMP